MWGWAHTDFCMQHTPPTHTLVPTGPTSIKRFETDRDFVQKLLTAMGYKTLVNIGDEIIIGACVFVFVCVCVYACLWS